MLFPTTPEPPYCAVIFSSVHTSEDPEGYAAMATRMTELASQQPGYLGMESVRDAQGNGITVSYWRDDAAALAWKQHAEHLLAQKAGKARWYAAYQVRVAKVTRAYGHGTSL